MKKNSNPLNTPAFMDILAGFWYREDAYIAVVAKEIDSTYTHTAKLVKLLVEKDVVRIHKQGRISKIVFTNKGREMGKAADIIKRGVK